MRRQWQSGIRSKTRRTQGGAVAVIVALSLAVLIGVVGLALDLGKLYVVRSELQNSADACALAAVRDLTGATINLSVSEAAGITAGNLNRVFFQSTPVQLSIDSNVTFSDSLANPFLPKGSVANPSTIKFVKCTTSLSNIANWFVQVLNVLPGNSVANASVSTMAVATTSPSQTTCAIPVFVCKAGTEPNAPAGEPDYIAGQWFQSKSGPTPNFGAGNFGWSAINGAYNANTISSELTSNQCTLPSQNSNVGSPGNKWSDSAAWNTRFGIYDNPYSQSGNKASTPDFTGYTYTMTDWTTTTNAYGGIIGNAYSNFVSQRSKFSSYQGDTAAGVNTKGNYNSTSYSSGADRRLALTPEVDCSVLLGGAKQAPVLRWDCVLMLNPMGKDPAQPNKDLPVYLEFEGKANSTGVPCAAFGIPGDSATLGPLVPVLVQ